MREGVARLSVVTGAVIDAGCRANLHERCVGKLLFGLRHPRLERDGRVVGCRAIPSEHVPLGRSAICRARTLIDLRERGVHEWTTSAGPNGMQLRRRFTGYCRAGIGAEGDLRAIHAVAEVLSAAG